MILRGVRGATTVESNSRDEILQATRQLLALMIRLNGLQSEMVASAIFTVTSDLNAEFPALAARQLGWLDVPMLCSYEISVPGSLPRCIRILVNWNTDKPQTEIQHVYIKDAVRLRPDLSKLPPVDFRELEHWIEEQMARREWEQKQPRQARNSASDLLQGRSLMNVKNAIRYQLDLGQMTAQRLLADFTDAELLERTCAGCNHPAWQLGHLIATEHRFGEMVRKGSMPPLPEGFAAKHSRDNAKSDKREDFVTKQEYLGLQEAQRGALLKLLDQLTEAELDQPAPESLRHMAPTVGAMFSLIAGHQNMHAGQLTPLRRKLGKPVVF